MGRVADSLPGGPIKALKPTEDNPKGLPAVWYVSKSGRKSFTDNPEMAWRDNTGAPIIAPGQLRLLVAAVERDCDHVMDMAQKAMANVWEQLLDQMEQYANLVDKLPGGEDRIGLAEFDLECSVARAEMLGVAKALAILELGHQFATDPDEALAAIRRMADAKYDLSVAEE